MCNLYSMTATVDELRRIFGPFDGDTSNVPPFDEIYPGYQAPVLRRQLHQAPFGLGHPLWSELPDLDLRMGLYRRLGELDDRRAVDEFAAELIDRFGDLPEETGNLLRIVETKINCRAACIAKLDVGAKGALVTFHNDSFPDLPGLLAYVERLMGTAKLRPDSKLVIESTTTTRGRYSMTIW